jgi:Zn-dependent protease with chaperone function
MTGGWLMWTPLAANVALALTGRRLARALPPGIAVRLLPVALVVVAAGTGLVLAAVGFFALAQCAPVALLGHWSPSEVRSEQPMPTAAEVVAGIVVVFLLAAALLRAARGITDLVHAAVACRDLGDHVDGLVVVMDDVPSAYTVPGLGGRVVVSTAMLRALDADERRALLAHEAAHLERHHHLAVQLADLAAAANPLLRRTARAVRLAVEREADEAAAEEVGDRRLVARALARAGLATAAAPRRTPARLAALAGADSQVPQRARALLAPAPRPRRMLAAGLVLLTLSAGAGAAATARQTDDRLDRAVTTGPHA